MKSILVPVEEHVLLGAAMEASILLARRFDSYIEGVPITPAVPAYIAAEATIGDYSSLSPTVRRERAAACRLHFETFMEARGIARASAGNSAVSFGWRDGDLSDDDFVASYARTFDITVLGRPSDEPNHPRISTSETVLFESGRPVLVVPPAAPRSIGDRIGIAWNRSAETARTVALAMPVLAKAQQITIIEVEGWGVQGPSGQDLARSLGRHGLTVHTRMFRNPHERAGGAILSAASAVDCDLLIKGAYTQSRLRQMFFGGATSHILAHTTLPVLIAH